MQHSSSPAQNYDDDEIDLRQLISVLWQQKPLIITAAVVGAMIGIMASLLSTHYVNEGFFFLNSKMTVSDYKRFESVFWSGPRLQEFLQVGHYTKTPAGERLYNLGEGKDALRKIISPEFSLTVKDQKDFGIFPQKDEPFTVGLRIVFKDKAPNGGAPNILLAEYIRDTMIRINFEGTMLGKCNDYTTREQEFRIEKLDREFAITQDEQRAANFRSIISRNPEGASSTSQIVSLEKGTERYLSPAAQLTATEIQIADMKLAEVRRERDRISSALKRDYYCQAQQALQQPITGRNFLEGMQNILTDTFQGQDKSKDIIEKTWNELDVERQNWVSAYLQNMRFLVSPEGAEVKERKPSLRLGLLLGAMLGGLLGLFGALIRNWWSNDPAASTADHST